MDGLKLTRSLPDHMHTKQNCKTIIRIRVGGSRHFLAILLWIDGPGKLTLMRGMVFFALTGECKMEAKALRESLQKMYSRMDYYAFCEYMEYDEKYDEKYWDCFGNLVQAVSAFDDESLQKIIDYSSDK